jgi:hypothetical protein
MRNCGECQRVRMCSVDPAIYLCEGDGVPLNHVLYVQNVTLVRALRSERTSVVDDPRRVYGC